MLVGFFFMETLATGNCIPEGKRVQKVQKVQKVQRGRYRRVAAMSFYNAAAGGSENHTTAPAASVGRFIGRSFYVQAKDQLRPTWRPYAGSPQWKCTPSAAYGGVSPGGGDFSGSII